MENNNAHDIWLPDQLTAVKLFLTQIECSLNEKFEALDGKTLYEYTVINKDASGILKVMPELEKSPIHDEYKKMLPLHKSDFIYQSVYKKTGGVLNLFYGEIKESMDNTLKDLTGKKGNRKEAIDAWLDTPSELYSALTPKLVWAGGGKIEKELLFDFGKKLTEAVGKETFYTQGGAVTRAIEFLRVWQLSYNDICDDTPMNAIIKERQEIYNQKVKLLNELGIEHDF